MTKFSRPNSFTKLNRSSPLAEGLVFWFAGNRPAPVDIISGRALTPSGTPPTFVRTIHGAAWQFSATYFLSTWTPVTAGPYTVTAWFNYTLASIRDVVSIANASTETDFVQMQAIGNTAERPVRLRIGDSGGTTAPDSDITTLGHQQSVWGHGAIVIQNPTSSAVYANGRHKTTNIASRTPSGLSRIGIGVQAKSSVASTFTGFISDVCIWNRALSDGEILSLYEPQTRWQLYEQKRSIWVVGRAPLNAYTMTASQASFTLTGNATGLTVGRKVDAAQASYTLTGQTAGLTATRLLASAQASYTLTGNATALLRGYPMTAAQASFSLTGNATGLYRGYPLTASQASFTLTGQATGLLFGRLLSATQASYTLSGQAANLLFGRLLTAAQAAYVLTGQDANLVYTPVGAYVLSANVATYALSGQASSLLTARLMAATQASYTLTGQSAGVLFGRTLPAVQSSYALTGQATGLLFGRLLSAAQAAYSLTGQASGLYRGYPMVATQASFTVTGQASGLFVARLIVAAMRTCALSGQDVTLTWSGYVVPPTPDERIFSVVFENRVFTVVFENRTYTV